MHFPVLGRKCFDGGRYRVTEPRTTTHNRQVYKNLALSKTTQKPKVVTSGRGGADDRPKTRSRGRKAAAILSILALGIFAYITYEGLEWYRSQPRTVQLASPPQAPFQTYSLSADQRNLTEQWGYPDSFQIFFFQEDLNGTLEDFRLESWDYYNRSTRISFLNGDLISKEQLDFKVGETVTNPYRPEQFAAFMSLDQVLASTRIPSYIVAPTEKELVENGEIYFADRITFGLVDGELVYAQTVIPELE